TAEQPAQRQGRRQQEQAVTQQKRGGIGVQESDSRGKAVAGAAHRLDQRLVVGPQGLAQPADVHVHGTLLDVHIATPDLVQQLPAGVGAFLVDRKSTRLNSSHVKISYAVFCLKKKK